MAQADGYVRIVTKIDDAAALKKLDGLADKVNRTVSSVQAQSRKIDELTAAYERLGEAGRTFTEGYENGASEEYLDSILAQLEKELSALGMTKEQIEGFKTEMVSGTAVQDTEAMQRVAASISTAKEKMDELTAAAQNARTAFDAQAQQSERIPESVDRSASAINRFTQRVGRMAKTALVFYGFRRLFTGIRNTMMSLSGMSSIGSVFSDFNGYVQKALEGNEQFSAALAKLRGALYTAFEPIMSFIVPAISTLCNWLSTAISYIAAFFSGLSGKSLSDSAKGAEKLAKGYDKVGGSAGNAAKQLASFDKLNNLNSSGGGGGSGGSAADFGFDPEKFKGAEAFGDKIAEIVAKIKKHIFELETLAAVSLAAIGLILIATGNIPLGIGALLGSGLLFRQVAADWDFTTAQTRKKVGELMAIVGTAMVALGLVLVLSGANIPLGIGMLLGGLTAYGTGVAVNWDAITDKVKSIKDKLKGLWEDIRKDFFDLKEHFWYYIDQIKMKFDEMKSKISSILTSIKAWFKDKFQFPHIALPHFTWSEEPVSSNFMRMLGITAIPRLSVSYYAKGGFPDVGSMFVAGEAGPELVGSFGGHSNAVVNEAQLVQAFQAATSQQTALLQQQNALLQAILEKSGEVTFRPSVSAGRAFSQSINMYARSMG
jgi:predicted PurR-regulated permease PerM